MLHLLRQLWREDTGQDMTEYALLLAFVVMCSAALLLSGSDSIEKIWTVTNDNLAAASTMAS